MSSPKTFDSYGMATGLVYLFNINVGSGVLTMPYAFGNAGWLLSTIILTIICLVSYITFTFVIDSMAIANAIIKIDAQEYAIKRKKKDGPSSSSVTVIDGNEEDDIIVDDDDGSIITVSEIDPISKKFNSYSTIPEPIELSKIYDITEAIEFGRMAKLFFEKKGVIFFYLSMIIYLYGDLTIYCAAISKTLRDMTCTYVAPSCNTTITDAYPCWEKLHISRKAAYRLYVLAVVLVLGPFTFFNLQKTKFLQVFTSTFRITGNKIRKQREITIELVCLFETAFTVMIVLTSIALIKQRGEGRPSLTNASGIPAFFGVAVFSFISHHSLPSIITPIKRKRYLFTFAFIDYLIILGFYLLVSFTAIFTFRTLNDVCVADHKSIIPQVSFLEIIIPLYPVFTISTNFPINAITLRNNLRSIIVSSVDSFHSSFVVQQICYPFLAIIPPFLIAISTENVGLLVGIVGNYAGICIQCILPALLIISARKSVKNIKEHDAYFNELLSYNKRGRSQSV
ncbi:transmembrane protein 104-like protein [Dinothrombium tinctorium]|uniref:Transmembrane protein 104-like protein n=1 Tax=Dinothrombium tinctorium TaxID=1965070 RepID=A0A3S3Q8Q1_9ACAR|nr:transmembrane protein 104-like protein [Dinothrombium tinctorium]RWS15926.1 transmembrane protein 104-like protein [Dinothrombium tinctorium]